MKTTIAVFCFAAFATITVFALDSLTVTSKPAGVQVWHEGVLLGTTPLTLGKGASNTSVFATPGGEQRLILYKDFYEAESVLFMYAPGRNLSIDRTMTPLRQLRLYDGMLRINPRLTVTQVLSLDLESLGLLRAEVYAKSGKPFDDPALKEYFERTRWYRVNPNYTDALLTDNDKANLDLIHKFLDEIPEDVRLYKGIMTRSRFTHKASGSALVFGWRMAVWRPGNETGSVSGRGLELYDLKPDSDMYWTVAGGVVYLESAFDETIPEYYIATFDVRTGELLTFTGQDCTDRDFPWSVRYRPGHYLEPSGDFLDIVKAATPLQVQTRLSQLLEDHRPDFGDLMNAALLEAAGSNPYPKVIDILIAAGADVDYGNAPRRTVFIRAIEENPNPEVVAALIRAGADLNDKGNDYSPLSTAAALGKTESVALLLKAGADVAAYRPLLAVAVRGRAGPDLIRLLAQAGDDPNASFQNSETPLEAAIAVKADVDVFDTLINLGANPKVSGLLDKAISQHPDPEVIDALVRGGADPNTGLRSAVVLNHKAIAEHLLAAGADPNGIDGVPLLMRTISIKSSYAKMDMMDVLLKAGADVNAMAEDGETVLMHAITLSSIAMTDRLLKAGADVNAANNAGMTPLVWVIYLAGGGNIIYPEILTLLLRVGADVNAIDQNGETPLLEATRMNVWWRGLMEEGFVVSSLLMAGADANARDPDGATPLINVIKNNASYEAFDALLKAGADVNARDRHGVTALMYAILSTERSYFVDALLDASADASATDRNGKRAIDLEPSLPLSDEVRQKLEAASR